MSSIVASLPPSAVSTSRPRGPIVALIPAFNEERFIGSLILTVCSYVDEVVVIDDGSSDRTGEIARKAGALVVQHKVNKGKAAAVNSGFEYIRNLKPFAVVMMDGDGQHFPEDIPQLLEPVQANAADVVVGSRFLAVKSDIPAYRKVGQHSLTMATNIASGVRLSDSQSGFRALSARALELIWFSQGGFSIESEMQFLVREYKLRAVEVPIKVLYAEPAKRNPISHGMQVVTAIMRLVGQIRPLLFFGLTGVLVFLTGLLLGLHVIDLYTETHNLAVGYALITITICIIGVLLFFAGVILHSVRAMIVDLRRSLIERQVPAVVPTKDESERNVENFLEYGM